MLYAMKQRNMNTPAHLDILPLNPKISGITAANIMIE